MRWSAQIPALLISVAAMVVSRVGSDKGRRQPDRPSGVWLPPPWRLPAGVVGMLGLIPGMPHFVFLLIASGMLGYLAWWLRRREMAAEAAKAVKPLMPVAEPQAEATWDDLVPVDTLGLEVGYRLIALVDKTRGDLLQPHQGRAAQVCAGGGLPAAAGAHPRQPGAAAQPVPHPAARRGDGRPGEAYPGMWLAIKPRPRGPKLIGTTTTDPAFGLPAVWIEERQRKWPKWPATPWLIVRPWWRPTFHT